MKIKWTIAALACSVTLVNAQQSPRPSPAAKPSAPAPRPRVQITEPWVTPAPAPMALPGVDLELPPMAMLAPGQGITPFPPMPVSPLRFFVTTTSVLPSQWPRESPI